MADSFRVGYFEKSRYVQIGVYRAKPVTPPKGAYRSVSGKARTEYRVRREPAHISNAERRISTKHFLSICTHSGARYTARPRPSRFDMPLRWLDMRPWGRENSPTNPNLKDPVQPDRLFLGKLPHDERGGHTRVEGFGVGLHGDVDTAVAGGDDRIGEAVALVADDCPHRMVFPLLIKFL